MSEQGWQELRFECQQANVEPLEDYLFESGAVAVTLNDNADQPILEPGPGETPLWDDVQVIALFQEGIDLTPVIENVPAELITSKEDKATHVPDQEWEKAWMESFHPMRMGERLWICPSWIAPPEPKAVNVMLDPGLAFGTGTHPTTAMCLGALDRYVVSGDRVVDYGCGTGILAIAALKLGAGVALGVDNDPQAITASRQNSERNGLDDARFEVVLPGHPSIDQWQGKADVVAANILAGPLADLAPILRGLLRPGGRLIMAGLLSDQSAALIETYAPEIQLEVAQEVEGWAMLTGLYEPR